MRSQTGAVAAQDVPRPKVTTPIIRRIFFVLTFPRKLHLTEKPMGEGIGNEKMNKSSMIIITYIQIQGYQYKKVS